MKLLRVSSRSSRVSRVASNMPHGCKGGAPLSRYSQGRRRRSPWRSIISHGCLPCVNYLTAGLPRRNWAKLLPHRNWTELLPSPDTSAGPRGTPRAPRAATQPPPADELDELPPHHSTSASARSRNDSGIVRPIALAVFTAAAAAEPGALPPLLQFLLRGADEVGEIVVARGQTLRPFARQRRLVGVRGISCHRRVTAAASASSGASPGHQREALVLHVTVERPEVSQRHEIGGHRRVRHRRLVVERVAAATALRDLV